MTAPGALMPNSARGITPDYGSHSTGNSHSTPHPCASVTFIRANYENSNYTQYFLAVRTPSEFPQVSGGCSRFFVREAGFFR